MSELLIVIILILLLYMATVGRTIGLLSALSIFCYMQAIMAIGIMPTLSWANAADRTHGALILATFVIVATFGSLVVAAVPRNTLKTHQLTVKVVQPRFRIYALIAVSIAISLLYFRAIGYLAVFEGLKSATSGSETDVAALRLKSYTGANYFYPGYVNQFKNALLPALVVVVITNLFSVSSRFRYVLAAPLALVTVILLLGTGQRGAFATFAIALTLYIYYLNREAFLRRITPIVAISLTIFLGSTYALGRSSAALADTSNGIEQVAVLLREVVFRIFGSNQESATAGFRYIYDLPTQGGADWILNIRGLLPGFSGSDLDNRIFASIYGSARGNAPLSLWGSAFYNFGFVGTLAFAALMGAVLALLSGVYARRSQLSTLSAIGYAGVVMTTSTWIAGTPVVLLNLGLVVYLALWWAGNRSDARPPTIEQRSHNSFEARNRMTTNRLVK
jgi:hypothetical protein